MGFWLPFGNELWVVKINFAKKLEQEYKKELTVLRVEHILIFIFGAQCYLISFYNFLFIVGIAYWELYFPSPSPTSFWFRLCLLYALTQDSEEGKENSFFLQYDAGIRD